MPAPPGGGRRGRRAPADGAKRRTERDHGAASGGRGTLVGQSAPVGQLAENHASDRSNLFMVMSPPPRSACNFLLSRKTLYDIVVSGRPVALPYASITARRGEVALIARLNYRVSRRQVKCLFTGCRFIWRRLK